MNAEKIKLKLKIWLWFCPENNYYPLILKSEVLASLTVLIFILKALSLPILISISKSPLFAEISKTEILNLTNLKRSLLGLPPLKEDPLLEKAAYLKAKDMLEKQYFAHWSPDGISPWYWFKKVGYDYRFAGENLAMGFLDSKELVEAWYNSFSHRENLLNPNYQDMGIAIVTENLGGQTTTLVVQLFGTKKEKIENKEKETTSEPEVKTKKPKPVLAKQTSTEKTTTEQTMTEQTTTQELLTSQNLIQKSSPQFLIFNFFATKYSKAINFLNYLLILIIIGYLALGILFDIFVWRKYVLDYKDLILKLGFFVFLLLVFSLIDKPFFLQLLPRDFKIL